MTVIEIGQLFALFLHFRESSRCFSVYLPYFSCACFFFFERLEISHCHYFKASIGLEIGLLAKIASWPLLKVQSETDLWMKTV